MTNNKKSTKTPAQEYFHIVWGSIALSPWDTYQIVSLNDGSQWQKLLGWVYIKIKG